MDSVCRVLLFVFCIGLVPASSQSSPVPPAMLGLWSAGSVDAIGSVQRQECSALTISERRIRLSTIPGTNKFEGEWIRTTANIWMTTDVLDFATEICRRHFVGFVAHDKIPAAIRCKELILHVFVCGITCRDVQ